MREAPKSFSVDTEIQQDLFGSLYFDELNRYVEVLKNNRVAEIVDCGHLAHMIGFELGFLYAISNAQKHYYRKFNIKKRNGSFREISEPLPTLKEIQKFFLKNIFSRIKTHKSARAYKINFSVKGNAKIHRGQKYILRLDFKNYFDSITQAEIFKSLFEVGYTKQLAKLISELVTLRGRLPQGAPTSPAISNIVMRDFDKTAFELLTGQGLRYTRYADDIIVSGETLNFIEVIRTMRSLAKDHGRKLNEQKTLIMPPGRKKIVTGLVVNDTVNTTRFYRRKIRQEMYYLEKFGLDGHLNNINNTKRNYLYHLLGKIKYVLSIRRNEEFAQYEDYIKSMVYNN